MAVRNLKDQHQSQFVKLFEQLIGRYSRWQIWADFVVMTAIELSVAVDKVTAAEKVRTYRTIAGKYTEKDQQIFAQMLGEMVLGLEEDPDQDFLGQIFMTLELGNDHNGQFFTPYSVCRMMAEMNDAREQIQQKGWISVNDCACGAGALLIAFANECRKNGINYQTCVLFVAQDIDYITACMCYIQLSLLGCAGYVVVGDTLSHPATSADHHGLIPTPGQNVWYTPMYFRDVWHWRRAFSLITA